jgi:hypothetical protein
MAKNSRMPKWHFTADSVFLSIDENVFNLRRLNRLCKMVMAEKNRFKKNHNYYPALTVNIQPYAISSKTETLHRSKQKRCASTC